MLFAHTSCYLHKISNRDFIRIAQVKRNITCIVDGYIVRNLFCAAMLSYSTFIEARWQKARRTLLAPGQFSGHAGAWYQDSCRMLRRVTLTKLYRLTVMCNRLHSNSLDNMIETKSTNQDFHCIVTNGKITVDSDAPPSKGGLSNGFRPHELLEAALATCINITVRMTAKEKNINLDYVSTQVDIDRSDTKTTFKYKILLDNKLSDSDRDFLMNIIDFCAVKQSLTKQLDFLQYE